LPELDGTDRDTLRMNVFIRIGEHYESSKPDSAMWWYSLAAKETNTGVRTLTNAAAFLGMGNVSNLLKKYTEAHNYFRQAMEIADGLQNDHNNKKNIIRYSCYYSSGYASASSGQFSDAITNFKQALKIAAEELKDSSRIASCNNGLGVITYYQGNINDALEYYARSFKHSEAIGDKINFSKCAVNLGVANLDLGNFGEAVSYFERALKIFEELGEKMGIAKCYGNMGNVAKYQGNYEESMALYEKAMILFEEIGDSIGISNNLSNCGNIAYFQKRYTEAASYYERSRTIAEKIHYRWGLTAYYGLMGSIMSNTDRYDEAISLYNQSLKQYEEMGDRAGVSKCLFNIGSIEEKKRNYPEALSFYERSLKIKEEMGNKPFLSNNYLKLSKLYAKTGETGKAYDLLQKSLLLTVGLLKDNFCILSEEERNSYLENTSLGFNDILLFYYSHPDYNDTLAATCYNNEIIRKGLLLKSTSAIMDVVYSSPDPQIKEAYYLLKQYRNQISKIQGTELKNKDKLIEDFSAKANEQERKLVKLSSEFANIQDLFGRKWSDVQRSLKAGEVAVEFQVFRPGNDNDTAVYAAMILTSDSKKPISVTLFKDFELQKILGGKSTGTGYDFVNSLYGKNSTALYNLIWKPLEPTLTGVKTVYYAPAGILNKISFAALSKEPGKMLCDIYNLQQVSTTGKLISKDDTKEMKMTAAVFGGIDYNPDTMKLEAWKYLPGTLNEKNSIEKQLKKNKISCQAFSGKEATEENFKTLFDSTDAPSILHVSTHGFFYPDPEQLKNEDKDKVEAKVENGELAFRGSNGFGNWMFLNNKNPMMRSGLVFAGANRVWSEDWGRTDNEGVLTAYEVSNLNMRNTHLVVLSACETGLGDIKGSEGVYGLQRAFKMAGVKYIIMSLWQVPDKETVEFMETFYKKLLKSKDVRSAFNDTQKEMRKKYDPYYWGAFVLVE
jgi:CHAT domain-containing protein